MGKISNYASALKAKLTDLFVIASDNNGVLETKKVTTEQIGDAIASDQTHSLLDTSDKTLIGGINENVSSIGTLSSLTTTDKSSIVGAVNEVNANKANKTLVNDLIKVKYFTLLAANVTQNMDLSSNVSLDSGYKFLCYMPTILPDGFTTDQYLWMSAPNGIQGRPWWKTNPIAGAGAGSKLRFFYLEIKDIN